MITVGIPVYNEGQYLEETILSVLDKADKIVISDNCSSDSTAEICKKYALNNKKIKYIRQASTIDVMKNFQVCLDVSDTEYFMFLGGHDLVSESYIECLVNTLEDNSDAILAYGPVKYFEDSATTIVSEYGYDYAEDLECKDSYIRVYSLMSNLGDCSLIHGVFRTELLKESFESTQNYHKEIGTDCVLLCDVATRGTFKYNQDTFFLRRKVRDETIFENTLRYINLFYEDVNLETIYTDFYKGLREGQFSAIEKIDNHDDNIRKFWLKESQKVLRERFKSRISVREYLQRWSELNQSEYTLFDNQHKIKKVIIFGTSNVSQLLVKECATSNIEVISYIDSIKVGEINGIPINQLDWLEMNMNEFDTIIISVEGPHDSKIISEFRVAYSKKLVVSWKNLLLYNFYQRIFI